MANWACSEVIIDAGESGGVPNILPLLKIKTIHSLISGKKQEK